ncbi:unnamed protein product [Candidula unifasciata]|uniref:Glutathione S-transferase n=1 Tax=Candidula unifasciata TaxID=100452 RepID=A0A8S3YPT6_9EUPU|nr:unnamed protein product [Candidula unifasciata]
MAPQNMKLIYFDGRGRAEVSRLILALAGQERTIYRFILLSLSGTPFGQLPVIEIDGKLFGQSIAIATYLAREFGFYGQSNLDGLLIDQAVQLGMDLLRVGFGAFMESDETKKAELTKTLKEVEVPKFYGFFEKLLKESGTGYFVGNSLTLADIFVRDVEYNISSRDVATADGFPLLQDLIKKVDTNERIKAYLATRKDTPF